MFLRSLKLNRLLSFGPDTEAVELRPLNVLIGPNGSGKSNFIEAIGLLQAAPKDLTVPIREGGGGSSWIWKGSSDAPAEIEAQLVAKDWLGAGVDLPLRHRLTFHGVGADVEDRLMVVQEQLSDTRSTKRPEQPFYFRYLKGFPHVNASGHLRKLKRFERSQSLLSQVKDPDLHREMLFVGESYEQIRIFRDLGFGRSALARRAQRADLPTAHLLEDTRNLGLVLNRLRRHVATKKALIEGLQQLFEGITDFSVHVESGAAQIFLEEEHWTVPATRLSDGTIRWLALLAILLDPEPPPLVCIEEPDLGLHPDLVHTLADLLKTASERMQIIVTTHSQALIDSLSKTPEDVIVCERRDGSTGMQRLDRGQLSEWLKEYSLAELWSKGLLGGTRW